MFATADMSGYSNYQLLAVDMVFTVAVPMVIVSFADSVLQFPQSTGAQRE